MAVRLAIEQNAVAGDSIWQMTLLSRIGLVLATASFFILCDVLSAYWGKQGSILALVLLCAMAPAGYLFFGLLNRGTTLSVSAGLVNSTIAVGTILVGIIAFQDVLTLRQSIGLVFAVLSVLLILV